MKPLFKAKITLQGRYDIEVKHADGASSFYPGNKNKIVNQGLDAYGGHFPAGYSSMQGAIIVGTGNTPPAATDTKIETPLALSNSYGVWTDVSNASAPYMTGGKITYTFPVGAVVGNIAEIGLSLNTGTTPTINDLIFSRALIQVGGSPGTITLTSSDQLIVTYEVTATYAADTTGSVNVTTDGTPVAHSFTVRPYNLGNTTNGAQGFGMLIPIGIAFNSPQYDARACSDTVFAPTTSTFLTNVAACNSASAAAYTAGTFTNQFTAHWNTGHTTFSEVMYTINFTLMGFQILFAAAFGITNVQTMDFTVQLTWASAT